jgi:CrcB protein
MGIQLQMLVWVALGSALGGAGRYMVAVWLAQGAGEGFPWGTLLVNVLGSFLIGLIADLTLGSGRELLGPVSRQFIMVGILGGFTTFSTFSLQTLELMRAGQGLAAMANSAATLTLCLVAVYGGHLCANWLNALRA